MERRAIRVGTFSLKGDSSDFCDLGDYPISLLCEGLAEWLYASLATVGSEVYQGGSRFAPLKRSDNPERTGRMMWWTSH